jgi:hypothetical protein
VTHRIQTHHLLSFARWRLLLCQPASQDAFWSLFLFKWNFTQSYVKAFLNVNSLCIKIIVQIEMNRLFCVSYVFFCMYMYMDCKEVFVLNYKNYLKQCKWEIFAALYVEGNFILWVQFVLENKIYNALSVSILSIIKFCI